MEALWSLTILLLCAPNIGLAQFINNSTAQTQCFYNVTTIRFGLRIDMGLNSTAGNYRINLSEEGGREIRQTFNIQSSNQNSSHEIKLLKPCTKYQHEVTFIDSDGNETSCNHTEHENKTVTTEEMREGEITDGGSIPGFTFFQSNWDISSSLLTPNKRLECINETCRLKLDFEDICSDFTATFTPGNCGNSSINVNKNITVDFLDPSEINHIVSTGLPATIEPTFPSKCNSLSVDYTCSENGKVNDSKKPSELEPFTEYNCSGLVKENNVSLDKRTQPIHVRIDCRFTINTPMIKTTNTSIELTWKTTSENCQDALPGLQKLSYVCSCRSKSQSKIADNLSPHPDEGKCKVTGLSPFTAYNCDIDPIYNKDRKDHRRSVSLKTDPGKPASITDVSVDLPENNVIKISCRYRHDSLGPHKIYRARLNDEEPREKTTCDFEFRDLSYSTNYTVLLTVFNGALESEPKTMHVPTNYNDKALIGFLCFLIVIIFVVVFVAIYKIYMKKRKESRSGVNDDMMLESAIYMNVRPPGWRHKAAH